MINSAELRLVIVTALDKLYTQRYNMSPTSDNTIVYVAGPSCVVLCCVVTSYLLPLYLTKLQCIVFSV